MPLNDPTDHTIQIRGLTIGAGRPKIIVPLVGGSDAEVLAQARLAVKEPGVDAVEWRADCYGRIGDRVATRKLLLALQEILWPIPLLFTYRTWQEGGSGAMLSPEEYYELNLAAAASGAVDLVDVEVFTDGHVAEHIAALHEFEVTVIGSKHDFHRTPDNGEMTAALERAWAVGADIPKLAVMPQDQDDVERLLGVTLRLHSRCGGRPLITISMGEMGLVSRIYGEVFGSAMTFGALGRASAPGQMPVGELHRTLERVHRAQMQK